MYNVTYVARMPEPTDVEEINVELFTRSTRGAYPKEKNEQRERARLAPFEAPCVYAPHRAT